MTVFVLTEFDFTVFARTMTVFVLTEFDFTVFARTITVYASRPTNGYCCWRRVC